MPTVDFSANVLPVVALMAVLALAEAILPFQRRPADRRDTATTNLALMATVFIVNWALASATTLLPSLHPSGLLARLGLPAGLEMIVGIVLLDFFSGYLAHRAMHGSALLWRVHRVHHADPFVDVTTSYRTHPIETAWRYLFAAVPAVVLGLPVAVIVLQRVLGALNALVEHVNVRLWRPLDAALSWVWVTPDMHKLHHLRAQPETDSNYGNLLSIHDRLFGTFTPTGRAGTLVYGLDDAAEVANVGLPALLAAPFRTKPDVMRLPVAT